MELTKEKYQNILGMLNSPDEQNKMMGLSVLNEQSFRDNTVKILLLKKHSNCSDELWKEHAPTVWGYMSEIEGLDVKKVFTFKSIMQVMRKREMTASDLHFYMEDFNAYLMNQFKIMGFDYIESIDITLKLKEDELSSEPSESM